MFKKQKKAGRVRWLLFYHFSSWFFAVLYVSFSALVTVLYSFVPVRRAKLPHFKP